jgi:hypothetical protein
MREYLLPALRGLWRRPVLWAVLATILAFLWQGFSVYRFHDGNWTALFNTGSEFPPPKGLASENIAIFSGTGYDGQFYHYVAHDPFLRQGWSGHFDAYAYRYGKTLLPGLTWLLALGHQEGIHATYIAVTLLFVALGALMLSQYAVFRGLHPAVGLLFLFVPASIVSLNNLTVDIALAALTAAFVIHVEGGSRRIMWTILAAAPLVRETGLLLIAGYFCAELLRRQWRTAALAALTTIPWAVWSTYLWLRAGPNEYRVRPIPLVGAVEALRSSIEQRTFIGLLDAAVVGGVLLAACIGILRIRHRDAISITCGLFGCVALVEQGLSMWSDHNALGRIFSPLFLLIAMRPWGGNAWLSFLPLALAIPRHLVLPISRILVSILPAPVN